MDLDIDLLTALCTAARTTKAVPALSISAARQASGLPSPVVVHPAEDANCRTCDRYAELRDQIAAGIPLSQIEVSP